MSNVQNNSQIVLLLLLDMQKSFDFIQFIRNSKAWIINELFCIIERDTCTFLTDTYRKVRSGEF